jgi:N-acetylglucosamine kinase-like BadF-type ATPase
MRKKESTERIQIKEIITKANFYGTGCGDKKSKEGIKEILASVLPNAIIKVEEDFVAAVHGTTDKPGVICIVGTGSNSFSK